MTILPRTILPRVRAAGGFTLLELVLALAIVGLLAAMVVPRLAALRGVALDASARQLANRIRFLREDAALRGDWVRFAVDPVHGRYAASVLVDTSSGARFVDGDAPLYRATTLPEPVAIELVGPNVLRTADGLPAAVFAPDGWADPAVVYLGDGAGGFFTIVIDPAVTQPRVFDRRIDARELISP